MNKVTTQSKADRKTGECHGGMMLGQVVDKRML